MSVAGVAGVRFDWLTTNGKHTYVHAELVEGLIDAHFAKAPPPFRGFDFCLRKW